MSETTAPFRLAFREEGDFVNAYLAPRETMKGAMLLASIRTNLVRPDSHWDDYVDFMKNVFTTAIKLGLGIEPTDMEVRPAPEHERSGKA